jgi:phosphoglycerate dehydrogenase-like enzyme
MKRVLITAPYMIRERRKIQGLLHAKELSVDWAEVQERLGEADLIKVIAPYHGIICGDDRITETVLERAKNLQVIVKWGTGIDSIDKIEAEHRGVPVFRTLDAFTEPVADSTLGAILVFARSIFDNDRLMKAGKWDKPQGFSLSEKTVGIIGLGHIGTAVAKRLFPFGPTVLANDLVEKDSGLLQQYNIRMVDKESLYENADFICLHCDLNPTSFHLFQEKTFCKLKKRPVLINMARGPIVQENALIRALETGMISGAALDVFEEEPLPEDSALRKMANVLLSAHNANSSPFYWQKVHENSVRMLLRGLGLE